MTACRTVECGYYTEKQGALAEFFKQIKKRHHGGRDVAKELTIFEESLLLLFCLIVLLFLIRIKVFL